MNEIRESEVIVGVKLVVLRALGDERGQFMETFRKEWFPERSWEIVQCNRSESKAGILRGLHYHHKQVDYWHVVSGSIRVGLADLRRDSSTFGAAQIYDLNGESPCGLLIPVGVAHGFYAQTDATLMYIVDNYYDGKDELGVAWNDATFGIDWGTTDPFLSQRDQSNPAFQDIQPQLLPG